MTCKPDRIFPYVHLLQYDELLQLQMKQPQPKQYYWAQLICLYASVAIITLLLTFPFYITAYRISVADLVPIDDYRQIVESLQNGHLKGFTAPFGYRILTPLLSIPLTRITPPLFSRISLTASQEWVQATFALCTVSYIFFVLTTLVLFAYLRDIRIPIWGIISALCIFWLSPAHETYLYPLTDASAIFFVSVLHWAYEKNYRTMFFFGSMLGVAAKEITIIVAGLTLIFHLCWWPKRRPRALSYLFLLFPSVFVYLGARVLLRFPGNEAQQYVWEYPGRFLKLPQFVFNLRGLLLNVYPLWPIAFAMLIFIIVESQSPGTRSDIFHWSNLGVTCSLIILAIVLDVRYNIGRIAFFSFPLFTPVIGWWIPQIFHRNC